MTLRKGSTGVEVRKLQASLNKAGYRITVDGDFGSDTLEAVKSFQGKTGLTADGIVGSLTWAKLAPYMVSDADFRKAFHSVLNDMEKLPSYKAFMEMIGNG